MTELKSCPFCGGRANHSTTGDCMPPCVGHAYCGTCGARTPDFPDVHRVTFAWNRRVEPNGNPPGLWIKSNGCVKCSECGGAQRFTYPFCPHCATRMVYDDD